MMKELILHRSVNQFMHSSNYINLINGMNEVKGDSVQAFTNFFGL